MDIDFSQQLLMQKKLALESKLLCFFLRCVLLSEYELTKPEVVHECLVVYVPQQCRQLDFIDFQQLTVF